MTQEEKTKPSGKSSGVSRREFLAGTVGGVVVGAAVGAAAGSLGFPKTITKIQTQTQTVTSVSTTTASMVPSKWDLSADIVIIGAGCAGMTAAIAARASGASVLAVEMNYDIGGKAIMSGGGTLFGGGTSAQKNYNINDSPDLFFSDLTNPATTFNTSAGSHYIDRGLYRILADNSAPTFEFLLANGVQFNVTAIPNTPPSSGTSWVSGTPRSESPYWNGASSFPASAAAPGGANGTGLMRPLENTARTKGVQFLLNYRMTSLIREQQFSGKVLGVTASYTGGRLVPGSTTPLQPYCTTSGALVPNQGNVNLTQPTVNIQANKAVILTTGGSSSNVLRRREADPRLTEVYSCIGDPYCFQTGDSEYAARKIGASLWAFGNETAENDTELTKPTWIGCQYGHTAIKWTPASPIFPLARAEGLIVSSLGDIVHVNMAGQRFAGEDAANYPWIDAAMAINPASTGPDYAAGPVWAIFDSAAVTRENWTLGAPYTDALFFYQANDLPTLATQINTNQFQTTPMSGTTLQATITRYNSFVVAGKDADFGKSPSLLKYQVNTPPYYAAFSSPTVRDWYTGLKINTNCQVVDLDGNVIPSLYGAGECVGGFTLHGLTKCFIFGRLAGLNAATGSTST
jgi:gas vesicle protein